MARDFLRSNRIPFKEYNINIDQDAERRFLKDFNSRTVPLLVVNGKVAVSGYYELKYEDVFGIEE